MTAAVSEVHLFNVERGEPEAAELWDAITERQLALMRRRWRVSLERLAKDADVTVTELVEIESDTRYKPALRTTYQLANYFKMPRAGFMQVAGLTALKNAHLSDEAVRFAARAEPTAELTPEENAALEAFVAVLSKQK